MVKTLSRITDYLFKGEKKQLRLRIFIGSESVANTLAE
jgi:hypothetical protein